MDEPLDRAREQIAAARRSQNRVEVRSFFDEPTNTACHVVADPATKRAAIVDSVLDFDVAACRISADSAAALCTYATSRGLTVDWLLETHAHADHLSAAPFLQSQLGGTTAIGREIVSVQKVFGAVFNAR